MTCSGQRGEGARGICLRVAGRAISLGLQEEVGTAYVRSLDLTRALLGQGVRPTYPYLGAAACHLVGVGGFGCRVQNVFFFRGAHPGKGLPPFIGCRESRLFRFLTSVCCTRRRAKGGDEAGVP